MNLCINPLAEVTSLKNILRDFWETCEEIFKNISGRIPGWMPLSTLKKLLNRPALFPEKIMRNYWRSFGSNSNKNRLEQFLEWILEKSVEVFFYRIFLKNISSFTRINSRYRYWWNWNPWETSQYIFEWFVGCILRRTLSKTFGRILYKI